MLTEKDRRKRLRRDKVGEIYIKDEGDKKRKKEGQRERR